jgi:hypothetical protein
MTQVVGPGKAKQRLLSCSWIETSKAGLERGGISHSFALKFVKLIIFFDETLPLVIYMRESQ